MFVLSGGDDVGWDVGIDVRDRQQGPGHTYRIDPPNSCYPGHLYNYLTNAYGDGVLRTNQALISQATCLIF